MNIEHTQSKQKEYYDKKFGAASCFSIGSEVFMKDFTRKKRYVWGHAPSGKF